jgi:hypothetical protein
MAFLPPQIKLALVFAQVAKNYGPILLHSNNADLLTKDLGNAMKKQKDILSDPKKGMIMTSYDVLPVIMEVKILSSWVASKLEIDTKGKSTIAILDEIVQKSDERNSGKYTKEIKDSLEWTRKLFSNPEIQDVLKMEMTEIEKPSGVSVKSLTKFFSQLTSRSQDELTRLNEFLKRAKEVQEKQNTTPPAPKAEPQVKEATPPAAEPPKPQPPKPDAPKP